MRLRGKPPKRWALAGLCLFSVVLMLLPGSRRLCHLFRPVLVPLSHAGQVVPVSIRTRIGEMTGGSASGEDARVLGLRRLLQSQQEIVESQRRKIDDLRQWRSELKGFRCRLIDARVVGSEGVPLRSRRLLAFRKGGNAAPGSIVTTRRLLHEYAKALPEKLVALGDSYVVGRIIDCAAFSATLQLVTDPAFEMPAALRRVEIRKAGGEDSGPPGKGPVGRGEPTSVAYVVGPPIPVHAQGNGREIVLTHVPAGHGIQVAGKGKGGHPGDLLIASESTELIPFGIRIGRVVRTEPEKENPHFVTVYVEPFADLEVLREVCIVLPVAE